MIALPGGGASAPAVDARTQLLNNATSGARSQITSGVGPILGRTDQGGMTMRPAVQKAAANAAQMLVSKAIAQKVVPSLISEHGSGQATNMPTNGADNFALGRLHQLVTAGLLGSMPKAGGDPAAEWRQLSSSMLSDPQNLAKFLAVLHAGQNGAHPNRGMGDVA